MMTGLQFSAPEITPATRLFAAPIRYVIYRITCRLPARRKMGVDRCVIVYLPL